jgi:hypothetical protein
MGNDSYISDLLHILPKKSQPGGWLFSSDR